MEFEKFEEFLSQGNMAKNTISAYLYAVKEFGSRHKELNKRNLLVYKTYLIETYKPKTVNLRIQAMNKYLVFVGKTKLRLKSVKVQQRSYLENVISNADYTFLKNYAVKYGLNEKVVYPHSFRHRYAKNFLEKFNDIALLADLMGHESIETTRIYLRRSSLEQQEIVDKVITW